MYRECNEVANKGVRLKKNNMFIEVGKNKKTLVNCLIGANNKVTYEKEINKIHRIIEMEYKPDIITDLSILDNKQLEPLWQRIVKDTPFISATLPIYSVTKKDSKISCNELLEVIIEQMENGVGMITIHPTANKEIYQYSKHRMIPITSRGGGIVVKDLIIRKFSDDNVYMKILPEVIKQAKKHNVTISIGATFRSGNIFDSNDKAQLLEIKEQVKIANEISRNGVGVIIESPGHAKPSDINKITEILNKTGFPIMPLGPIPTDIAVGMDHISAGIGATLMGLQGCANIIATVTRDEHTGGVPSIESTIEAIRVAKIAAHIIDMEKLNDVELDEKIVKQRVETRTCVFGKKTSGCERCSELCPLNIV